MVTLVVVFAAGSGAAPSKVTRLAATPTTTTDCEGNTLNPTPPATYASTDLLKGSNFEIDAITPVPVGAKNRTLPTDGANQIVNHTDCFDW